MVRLAGGRSVVVDAKVPLDAFLDATSTDDARRSATPTWPATRASCAATSSCSGSKRYWRSLPETPEFVVLFLPAESFLLGRRSRPTGRSSSTPPTGASCWPARPR